MVSFSSRKRSLRLRFVWFVLLCLFSTPLFALSIDVSGINNPVAPNGFTYYRIVVGNTDGADRTNVMVTAPVPEHSFFSEANALPATDGSCSVSSCQFGETAVWNLGNLSDGDSKVITVPFRVASSAPADAELALTATVTHDGDSVGQSATYTTTVKVDPVARVSLSSKKQVIESGATSRYEVSFGNISASTLLDAEVAVTLPADVTFASASDGGTLSGNTITWDLSNLSANAGGKRFFTVTSDGGLEDGAVLAFSSVLRSEGSDVAQAKESNVVRNNVGLTLDVTTIGDRSQPDDLIYYRYVVANKGVTDLADVTLDMMVSERTVFQEARTAPVTTSSCSISTCQPGEWGSFAIG
ncbi:hypothetical protein C8D92_103254, partial [Tamilnaduibacter salinus]